MKEAVDVDGLDALIAAGRRLRELDPERFQRVLALCRLYVSVFDRPEEDESVFLSRVAQAMPRPKAQA
jgi:hypothetical protein